MMEGNKLKITCLLHTSKHMTGKLKLKKEEYKIIGGNKVDTVRWKLLLIHTLFLWIATFISGFVMAVANAPIEFVGYSNMFIVFITIIIITIINRISWKHYLLLVVALGVTSLPNIVLYDGTLLQVLGGTLILGLIGLFGKLIGDLILYLQGLYL